jgi:adenylyl cyclase-associated protein
VDPFVAACDKLGGGAANLGKLIKEAWLEMRAVLHKATACKEPTQAALGPVLGGVVAKMKEVSNAVQRNEWEKHAKTCQEGVQCLNWLVVKPAPRDFIENYIGGSDYWANNIRKEYKSSNPDQIAFCNTFKKMLQDLMVYVKEHHTTGVAWNPRGVDVSEFSGETAAPVAAKKEAPKVAAKPSGGGDKAGLFASLSKGGEITSGLKTVTKDQQTWRKEFNDKDAKPVVVKKAPVPRAAEKPKGTPKNQFNPNGSKWEVEYQSADAGPITITIADKKETVYILGCIGANVTVSGKCKSIILDSCKKTQVHFDACFASCEVVNSQRVQLYCREKVTSVAIDKTDGIIVHLPATSLDSEVVASKSSEMNLSWIGPDGEPVEKPIPEQYVHRIDAKGNVTADVSDLYS